MSGLIIDAFEFCRLKERRQGERLIADLPRLAAEAVDPSGALKWAAEGGKDALGHPQLTLAVTGSIKLVCQRCLQPFDFGLASESALVLARDEAGADEIEEQLGDDSIDVIVGSAALDLIALVEDEALLALPLSPKHEACSGREVPNAAGTPEKQSPFSVLKNLKKS